MIQDYKGEDQSGNQCNPQPKRFRDIVNLDVLNFIGSICSISALLIVVFNDLNWLKGLNIIISLTFAFCCGAALVSVCIPSINKMLWKSIWAKICAYMAMSIGVLFILTLIFYGFYMVMEYMEHLIIGISKDL